MAFVRSEAGDHFQIEVAAHPEFHPDALSADVDLACFKRKIEAGATSALTQSFYNADAYFHFVESCSRFGVTLPIVQSVWDGQRLDEERRTACTPPEDVRSDKAWGRLPQPPVRFRPLGELCSCWRPRARAS